MMLTRHTSAFGQGLCEEHTALTVLLSSQLKTLSPTVFVVSVCIQDQQRLRYILNERFGRWDKRRRCAAAVASASANVGWNKNLDESTFTIFYPNPVLFHSHFRSLCPRVIALNESALRIGHFAFSHQLFFFPMIPCFSALSFSLRSLRFFAFTLWTFPLRVAPVEVNSYRKSYILKYPYKSGAPLLSSSQPRIRGLY